MAASTDSFELDCRMDEKVELIEAEFGLKGFAIIVKLYQNIYSTFGYYCEWTPEKSVLWAYRLGCTHSVEPSVKCRQRNVDKASKTGSLPGFSKENVGRAFEMGSLPGFPKNLINEVVAASIKKGIFSEELFAKYRILTSSRIQERYLNAVSERENEKLKKEYLLVCVGKNSTNVIEKPDSNEKTNKNVCENVGVARAHTLDFYPSDNIYKKHTPKPPLETHQDEQSAKNPGNSKNANGSEPKSEPDAEEQLKHDFNIIYALYPKKVGRTVAFANYKLWVSDKGKDVGGTKYRLTNRQIYMAVKKYVTQQEQRNTELRYWKNFDTLMGRQLLDYVDWEEEKK